MDERAAKAVPETLSFALMKTKKKQKERKRGRAESAQRFGSAARAYGESKTLINPSYSIPKLGMNLAYIYFASFLLAVTSEKNPAPVPSLERLHASALATPLKLTGKIPEGTMSVNTTSLSLFHSLQIRSPSF